MSATLTPAERLDRQRADHRMLGALDASPAPIYVTGHRSADDARNGRNPVSVGDRTPPSHYRVVYDFDTLRGPGQRHRPTVVHVAPLASNAYPATAPSAWVIGEVVPWTPHFARNRPICHGTHVWKPNRTQLVDYVIHIGKLLNFDEPPPTSSYDGYNNEAIRYWKSHMGLRPLNAKLRLPNIRPEDVIRPRAFAPASRPSTGRFKRADGAPPPSRSVRPGERVRPRFARAGNAS
ncbi:MAG TPA: hypothetical protein VGY13_04905 [Solirubrobacteraceae bacterium]|jgi:hypothetical protein|nr:hypothetical protein [Solirubrobacteraceae bacterium]